MIIYLLSDTFSLGAVCLLVLILLFRPDITVVVDWALNSELFTYSSAVSFYFILLIFKTHGFVLFLMYRQKTTNIPEYREHLVKLRWSGGGGV